MKRINDNYISRDLIAALKAELASSVAAIIDGLEVSLPQPIVGKGPLQPIHRSPGMAGPSTKVGSEKRSAMTPSRVPEVRLPGAAVRALPPRVRPRGPQRYSSLSSTHVPKPPFVARPIAPKIEVEVKLARQLEAMQRSKAHKVRAILHERALFYWNQPGRRLITEVHAMLVADFCKLAVVHGLHSPPAHPVGYSTVRKWIAASPLPPKSGRTDGSSGSPSTIH